MATSVFSKDPDAVLDYIFDWSKWMADGDSIVSYSVSADSSEIVIDSDSMTAERVTAWLSSGVSGGIYRVTCQIVTTDGRTDDRSMSIKVFER